MKKSEAQSLPRDFEPEADLAGALHEVSNALTVVLGWLDAALARLPAQGPEREPLEEALDVARTHARLGHRVARQAIGADLHADGTRERPARAMARCALLGVTPAAERRGVTLRLDDCDEDVALVSASGRMLQVLTNLLLNAVEFSPEAGEVTVGVRQESGRVMLTVTDQGPGIDPEHAARLLGSDGPPESRRRGGAGLGLRHSAALARATGGDLRLVRSGPGSCFELEWPLAEARSGARTQRRPVGSLEGLRVLVIEDDAAVRTLIEVALEARGAEVVTAASVTAADMPRAPWSAALVDLSPIASDIRGSLERIHGASPGAPVILISGTATGVPSEADGKVAAWVRKPFEMGEVVDVLLSVLRSERARRA